MATIRAAIARLPRLAPEEAAARNEAVAAGRCPLRLWPLWPIAGADAGLWRLLAEDEKIAEFSVYGLFPAAYEIVYGGHCAAGLATARYDGRTRGRVAIISRRRKGGDDDNYGDDYGDDDAGVVIKPAQSRREPEIAAIAGRLKIGPRQRATLAGFISEEFVPGVFLTELPPESATPARMRAIGRAVAAVLRGLHAAGICYNDATISDPEGRAHIIVRPDGGIRLIDFGVALLLDDHPAGPTFEDAYNAARTDPSFRLLRRLTNPDADTLGQLVSDYGRRLAGRSAAEIQARDWNIADQGASFLAGRYGAAAGAALRDGLAAGRP